LAPFFSIIFQEIVMKSYADANSTVRREADRITVAGATTEGAKFRSFQKIKLKQVHAAVITAGTATAHGYNVFQGTTSVGAIALGTSAAGASASSGVLDLSVASMEQLSVKSLADVVGVAHIVYEYEVLHDAVQS
jgi:hypothetical protein